MDMALKFANQHIDLNTIKLPEWIKGKKDWRGNSCKDIKDFIELSGNHLEETLRRFKIQMQQIKSKMHKRF
jgi:hypothetical protein